MCRVIQILFDCKSLKTLSFLYTFVSALHIVLPTKQHSRFSYWIAKACGKGFVDLAGSRSIFLLNLTIYCRFKKLSQVSLRDRYSFWLQNIIQTILFVSFYIQFEVAERFISFHQLHIWAWRRNCLFLSRKGWSEMLIQIWGAKGGAKYEIMKFSSVSMSNHCVI